LRDSYAVLLLLLDLEVDTTGFGLFANPSIPVVAG
jgi:hypothetical protein